MSAKVQSIICVLFVSLCTIARHCATCRPCCCVYLISLYIYLFQLLHPNSPRTIFLFHTQPIRLYHHVCYFTIYDTYTQAIAQWSTKDESIILTKITHFLDCFFLIDNNKKMRINYYYTGDVISYVVSMVK